MLDDEIKKGNEEAVSNEELQKCIVERDEYLSGWKRAKADYINYKKDEEKRFEETIKFGTQGLIKELLVVLDSFDLAIVSMGERMDKGVCMISGQLEDILKKFGLSRITVEVGKMIDHREQEAMIEIESESPPGTVIEELERGYMLHGRVIRPARVKIAKEKQSNQK